MRGASSGAIEPAARIAYYPPPQIPSLSLGAWCEMIDYEIQRCSRRCAATDRELNVGEVCYSVLVPEGAAIVRRDYAAEAWPGPPDTAIGWWQTTIVDPQAGRLHWAPSDVMLNYFERLRDDQASEDARYVLALLLVRRRVLRVEEYAKDDLGREILVLYCGRSEAEYRVAEVMPTPERAAAIQQQLAELLQTHGR
jgi:hypothetical protein